jgi:glycosyltransferase involved in cell wall biosynthesis
VRRDRELPSAGPAFALPGPPEPTGPARRKLVIQIPCYDEEQTLPETLDELPLEVEGFDEVEIVVVDDGSHDRTGQIALEHGAHLVVRHDYNQGLASAFMTGIETALGRGADVIVNTDADHQYRGADIAKLVRPILDGEADIVVGARPIDTLRHFSLTKRWLQRLGSRVVRALSGTRVRDAPSGFRAMTRDAALRLNVFGRYTYTLETIIQAGLSHLRVVDRPIEVHAPTRPSRLIRTNADYVWRGVRTMLSVYLIYKPVRLFCLLAALFLVPGAVLGLRYLWLAALGEGRGHVQSVIVAGALVVSGIFMLAVAAVAHLQSINRRLLEELRYHQRRASRSDEP